MIRFTLDHQEREYPDDTPLLIAAKPRWSYTQQDKDFISYLCREYIREQETLKDTAEYETTKGG